MAMVTIRHETPFDVAAREALLDEAFGECRSAKTAQRLRDGRLPSEGLSFVAIDDERVIGTVAAVGRRRRAEAGRLLLGPIAVACDRQGHGVGGALMRHACERPATLGHEAVLLVGDAPYYSRFGFSAEADRRACGCPAPTSATGCSARELRSGGAGGRQGHDQRDRTARAEAGPRPALVAGASARA